MPLYYGPFKGRTATYVIAASNAPAHVKAQADKVCDGVNDQEEIQWAIDALTPGRTHKEMVKCIGSFSISAAFNVISYTVLDLSHAKFTLVAGANCSILKGLGVGVYYYVDVLGGEFDGNKANQTGGLYILDLPLFYGLIEGCNVHDGYKHGIYNIRSGYTVVKRNIVKDCNYTGITEWNDPYGEVSENLLINCGTTAPHPAIMLWSDKIVSDNIIIGGGVNCQIYCGARETVEGNYLRDGLGMGIAYMSNSLIVNNTLVDTAWDAIDAGGGKHNIIIGNHVLGVYGDGGDSAGITNSPESIIEGNIVEFCDRAGIWINPSEDNLIVKGNTVRNCSQTVDSCGIYLTGEAGGNAPENLILEGNRAYDDQGGKTSNLTANAAAGQKVVAVADGSVFEARQAVTISDLTPLTENNIIASISGNNLTMRSNLANTYTVAQSAKVDGRQTQLYGILQRNDGGQLTNPLITNNNVVGSPTVGILLLSATGQKVQQNIGYVTENSGTATVLNTTTTIVVTHGLATTPTRVLLTARLWSNAAKVWVTTLTTTQFTINVDADPGAGTAIFDWRAQVGEG